METHILFFILAGLLIAILVGYSLWSARREKSRVFSNTFSTRPPATSVNNTPISSVPPTLNTEGFNVPEQNNQAQQVDTFHQQELEHSVRSIKISLDGQSTESHLSQQTYDIEQTPVQQSQPVEESQIHIAEPVVSVQSEPQAVVEAETPQQIITLYVVAAEGQQFYGEAIQQNLEALGFQFGEYQIFHRHLDSSASPVLFSAANMMQPGVFDLNQMEYFTTVGLVFFMHLPSAGSDLANLRSMLNTVEKFAQSMGGFVLDEQQQLFNDETRRQYLLRVAK